MSALEGPRSVINRAHTRTDALNLTNIFDVVSKTRFQHDVTPANRLQNALCFAPLIHVAR